MNRQPLRGFRVVAAMLAAVMIAAVAHAGALSPVRQRMTDASLQRDLSAMATMDAALRALPDSVQSSGAGAAVDAWLAAAREAYLLNDESDFAEHAFGEAGATLQRARTGAPWQAGALPLAIGPALVSEFERLKVAPGAVCAEPWLARMEVALRVAEHAAATYGECAANAARQRASAAAVAASQAAAECAPAPIAIAPSTPALVASDMVVAPALQMPTQEELRIARDVYFGLARHDLSPASQGVIKGIVDLMLKYPSLQVHLVGHTDSRASAAYNLALSKRRVDAVRTAMVGRGVETSRITSEFRGKAEQAAAEDSRRGFALNRRVEMRFFDAEGRKIEAEHQEQDLQLEPERAPAPKH